MRRTLSLLVVVGLWLPGQARPADWKSEVIKPVMPYTEIIAPDGKHRAVFVVDPNGINIASGNSDTVALADASGKVLARFSSNAQEKLMFQGAFHSADPNVEGDKALFAFAIAVQTFNRSEFFVHVADVASGKVVKKLKTASTPFTPNGGPPFTVGRITGMTFTPDGKTIYLVEEQGALAAWDLAAGKKVPAIAPPPLRGMDVAPHILQPVGSGLLVCFGPELCITPDLKKWSATRTIPQSIDRVLVAPDAACIAVHTTAMGANNVEIHKILVLDAGTLKERASFTVEAKMHEYICIDYVPGRDQLLTALNHGGDGTVTIWNTTTGKPEGTFRHPVPAQLKGRDAGFVFRPTASGQIKTCWMNEIIDGLPGKAVEVKLWTPPEK